VWKTSLIANSFEHSNQNPIIAPTLAGGQSYTKQYTWLAKISSIRPESMYADSFSEKMEDDGNGLGHY
jgi:hypothetical protein